MARKINHPKATTAWRLWSRVRFDGPISLVKGVEGRCWPWDGKLNNKGYGSIGISGSTVGAHRWPYEQERGAIPAGLHADHLCRNRACVRPSHIEPVTCRVNTLRGANFAALKAAQTHCIHGHEFTAENTYRSSNGTRKCRACIRARRAARYASDPAYRERACQRERERYQARKQAAQATTERTAA